MQVRAPRRAFKPTDALHKLLSCDASIFLHHVEHHVRIRDVEVHGRKPVDDLRIGHHLDELLTIQDAIACLICCLKQRLHLLDVLVSLLLRVSHHDLVIIVCCLEGFLEEYAVDHGNQSISDGDLVNNGESGESFRHMVLQKPCHWRPIPKSDLEHGQQTPGASSKVEEELVALSHQDLARDVRLDCVRDDPLQEERKHQLQ
mmetsp:Transcript_70120/g.164105  ORF Transcript_70120/g.164105 Transcript_70120/m.164105 type:complete len:202 (-) Transcript_70120:589-1194(-)